jgi:hypothetical protein
LVCGYAIASSLAMLISIRLRAAGVASESLYFAIVIGSAADTRAAAPAPEYPEAVIQWEIKKGATRYRIANMLHDSAEHIELIYRDNRIA